LFPNLTLVVILLKPGCTGTATVAPTGGTGAFTYTWSPGSLTTSTVGSLCPNNYTVVVEDANNCTDTVAFTINQPTAVTATVSSTDPTCFGLCNGSATVTPSGGTGTTYTVGWSPNICVNCPVATNLCGIQYTVTVVDSNGCQNSQILTLTAPQQIQASPTVTDPICFGNTNGSVFSNTSGGTGPYTYTWTPPVVGGTVTSTATTSTYTNIPAGSYTLIINDANGCADTTTHVLNPPVPLSMSSSATSANCGQSNGSITISSVNGNGAITVQWLPPSTCGSSLNCTNLAAGVYSVELTDSKGCKDTFFVAVTNPNGPVIDSVMVNDSCFQSCSGAITVNVVSGINVTTPYSFTWTPS